MKKNLNIGLICISLSICYLAYSLLSFSAEIKRSQESIPAILTQVKELEEKVEIPKWVNLVTHLEKKLPSILKDLEKVNTTIKDLESTIPEILVESKGWREKTLPQLLTEVKKTRKALPGLLNTAKGLIKQGKKIGEDATEGAIEGTVKGIIDAPEDVIKDVTDDL